MKPKETLDKFADELYKKASEKSTSLQESTDAFKALTSYYSATHKARKTPDEEPDEGGFSFANEDANGGSQKVSGRRAS